MAYALITLQLVWGGPEVVTPYLAVGPGFHYEDPIGFEVTVEPTTITWTPEGGFGLESFVTTSPVYPR